MSEPDYCGEDSLQQKQAIQCNHERLVLCFSYISSQGKAIAIEEETIPFNTDIFV